MKVTLARLVFAGLSAATAMGAFAPAASAHQEKPNHGCQPAKPCHPSYPSQPAGWLHPDSTRPTLLSTREAAINLLPLGAVGMSAKLTDAFGTPLAGRQLEFKTLGGRLLCTATTGWSGWASCDAALPLSVSVLDTALNGYFVSYAGSTYFWDGPSQARGAFSIDIDRAPHRNHHG